MLAVFHSIKEYFRPTRREGTASFSPEKILSRIIPFLTHEEIFCRAVFVSKTWKEISETTFFSARTLCPKWDHSLSYKAHYLACEALNINHEEILEKDTLLLRSHLQHRALFVDEKNALVCCAFHSRVKNVDHVESLIWDLSSNQIIKRYQLPKSGIDGISFGGGYLAHRTEQGLAIKDITHPSDDSVLTIHSSLPLTKFKHIAINAFGITFVEEREGIKRVAFLRWTSTSVYSFKDYTDLYPLLHQLQLIYPIGEGKLQVRNIGPREMPSMGQIISPTWFEAKIHKHNRAARKLRKDIAFTSISAHQSTLVTLSKREILICNLSKMAVVQKLTPSDSLTEIQMVRGHSLFFYQQHNDAIVLLDSDGSLLREWCNIHEERDDYIPTLPLIGYAWDGIILWQSSGNSLSGKESVLTRYYPEEEKE